jgi:oligopeptidase B
MGVGKEKSRKYILISSSSTLTTEFRTLPADAPEGKFKVFQNVKEDMNTVYLTTEIVSHCN